MIPIIMGSVKTLDIDNWRKKHAYSEEQLSLAKIVLEEVKTGRRLDRALRSHPGADGGMLAKHILIAAYKLLVESGEWQEDEEVLKRIRMKPVRTLSGVTTVTVLTKEYPCPGRCIFCPTENYMPKSYLADEPGAARAFQNKFDPFNQVNSRILEYEAVGHPTDKIELLILGGTWSSYRRDYQKWFVQRCFDAMNVPSQGEAAIAGEPEPVGTPTPAEKIDLSPLRSRHIANESAAHRNVGLVIETRPDEITPEELVWLRKLGVTKVQMGAQSLDDRVLELNLRGHDSAQTLKATALLRAAGFKIVLHWMPNLLGATLDSDRADFKRLWNDGFAPDEIKIYPTQLLESAELYKVWQRGEYTPYTTEELIQLIADLKESIPQYCRVNRVIRDIPSIHVVEGNKRTSLRQDVMLELHKRGKTCRCVRCREVRTSKVDVTSLRLDDLVYNPAYAEEHFISYVTPEDQIAGYLRLSLPDANAPKLPMADLDNAALVREVHVYGQSLAVGQEQAGAAQHIGLGTALLKKASEIARSKGYSKLAVIAAIGTRKYYESRGFERGELYLVKDLTREL
ncbi:MAG: tRNA uridine(34) 5-carboxymethylaminomethyl modification radical SAM/GNAT enzyme Elp3 [Anaerolineaceae bacterium]|nr:tRNA uridine(34) 5-carboxymethylaminomethyl modification radical SAM/GNAT enzyme Elp3 [Anaerolineaceae bacterium]